MVRPGETFDCTPHRPRFGEHDFGWKSRAVIVRLIEARGFFKEAFLGSTGIVALAEMGDKTQLLALVLAACFRKPWPIVCGIFVATIANHAMAGALGAWVTNVLSAQTLRWILGVSFIAMAVWMLIPDKLGGEDARTLPRFGVFVTTVVVFFLAEMGDKTQIATVMLAARFNAYA